MHHDHTLPETQRLFERIQQARAAVCLHHDAVHQHLESRIRLWQGSRGIQAHHLSGHQQPGEAQALQFDAHGFCGLRPRASVGKANHERLPCRVLQQGCHDATGIAALHGSTALLTVQLANLGEQQAYMVGEFGHRADRRARIFNGITLIDSDSWWNAFDALDLRLVHTLQELSGIGGKTFHVAPLSLGVQRVERQTRFARAAHARDDDELVQG